MFPLGIMTYVKIGLCAVLLCGAGYLGYSLEAARFDRYKANQIAQTQKAQEQHQAATDQIRKDKDAQITSINNQLVDAISELRKRPNRTQAADNGSCGTGATLSAEDAEFLEREAARADIIRAGLSACYQQYDALTK
jgi:hypothetical protein